MVALYRLFRRFCPAFCRKLFVGSSRFLVGLRFSSGSSPLRRCFLCSRGALGRFGRRGARCFSPSCCFRCRFDFPCAGSILACCFLSTGGCCPAGRFHLPVLLRLFLCPSLHSYDFLIADGVLPHFSNDHQPIAIGAELEDRAFPDGKIAGWIIATAVEDALLLLRLALH